MLLDSTTVIGRVTAPDGLLVCDGRMSRGAITDLYDADGKRATFNRATRARIEGDRVVPLTDTAAHWLWGHYIGTARPKLALARESTPSVVSAPSALYVAVSGSATLVSDVIEQRIKSYASKAEVANMHVPSLHMTHLWCNVSVRMLKSWFGPST